MINNNKIEKETLKKVSRRIVPYIFILYIIAFLDRVNIGYAALDMNAEIGLSAEFFGFASGIFFIGYFFFEVPSNVLMDRFGARKWLARIMITWGIIVIAEGYIQTGTQLAVLRFLLGVAEAGFAPGVILYITYWFRKKDQARIYAYFLSAIAASSIIGAPFSTWILDNVAWFGMAGWRWIFILQGIPAVIAGVFTLFYLTDRPHQAKWLNDEEREWLVTELAKDHAQLKEGEKKTGKHFQAFFDKSVWHLAAIYFTWVVGLYGIGLWLPTIIREFSALMSHSQVGLIAIVPYILGGSIMIFWGINSDRTGERKFHTAIPLLLGAIGMVSCAYSTNPFLSMALISLTTIGLFCFVGAFWSLASTSLTATAAVVGIAIINSFGNLGGFVGPYIVGYLRDATGSIENGLLFLGIDLFIGFLLLLIISKRRFIQAPSST